MKNIKRFLVVSAAVFGLLAVPLAFAPGSVSAQASDQAACQGLGGEWSKGSCSVPDEPDIDTVIANLIRILSAIAGVAAVIMIIISGFRFITANGDAGTVAAARRTLVYALVGVIIVALSQTIVWFMLRETVG